MRLFIAALLTGAVVAVGPALAEPGKSAAGDLHRFVAGKTVVLKTSMGPMPISYSGNGTMQGRADSRSLAAYAGQAQDHGTWWVEGDHVCQRWSKWLDGRSLCFSFTTDGRIVHWRSTDGQQGTAVIAAN
jgi:hypothetical protein